MESQGIDRGNHNWETLSFLAWAVLAIGMVVLHVTCESLQRAIYLSVMIAVIGGGVSYVLLLAFLLVKNPTDWQQAVESKDPVVGQCMRLLIGLIGLAYLAVLAWQLQGQTLS